MFDPMTDDRVIVVNNGDGTFQWRRTRVDGTTILASATGFLTAEAAADDGRVNNKVSEVEGGPAVELP